MDKPPQRTRILASPMAKQRKPSPPKDFAILHGPTEDGEGARMLRFKAGEVYAGEVRPLREGKPIGQHEVVRLRRLGEHPALCEVEVLHSPAAGTDAPSAANEPAAEASTAGQNKSHGPARVANDSYRRNWNTVFGAKPKPKRNGSDWSVN
jgi:hypothetical protein